MASIALPNLVKRRNVWFARMLVPSGVQTILGRKVLIQTTGETDPLAALRASKPILAGWRHEIAQAKAGALTPLQDRLASLAADYRTAIGRDEPVILEEAIAFVAKRLVGVHPDDVMSKAYPDHQGDQYAALGTMANGKQAQAAMDIVTGNRTPFLIRHKQWSTTLLQVLKSPRQQQAYTRMVSEFSKALGDHAFLELFTPRVIKEWVEQRVLVEGMAPRSAKNITMAVRHYWRYLQGHEIVQAAQDPFTGLRMPRVSRTAPLRRPMLVADVFTLEAEAAQRGRHDLQHIIMIGAWTGARIGELCALRWDNVDLDAGTIGIVDSKTAAGIRIVPIITALDGFLRTLKVTATDDYVIPGLTASQFGERGHLLAQNFSNMKMRLGYGRDIVFHSIRKLVATLLENAQVPEGIAADILGHEKPTMTYGLYSGGASLEAKREALEKALVPLTGLWRGA